MGRRSRGAVAPAAAFVAAAWLAVAAAPASATVTTIGSTFVGALAPTGSPLLGLPASFPALPPPTNQRVATSAATSTSALVPFPLDSPYAVLSTGNTTLSDQPGSSPNANQGTGPGVAGHGDSSYDTAIFSLGRISAPAGQSCLSFDFRLLSAEYPNRVGAQFNDALIAELVPNGTPSTWTATGGTLGNLQNDFAVDGQGRPMTVNEMGPAAMSPAEAAGSPYGGATAPLRAQIPVTQQSIYDLYLSIFDLGDAGGDTRVFLDNLTFSARAGATCTRGVAPLGPSSSPAPPSRRP